MIFIPLKELLTAIERLKVFFLEKIGQSQEKDLITKDLQTSTQDSVPNNDVSSKQSGYSPKIFKKSIHIYSHLDADGLCSAAIIARMLERKGIGFQITILRQLELQYIQNIAEEQQKYNRFIIFSDFGSGQIEFIEKYFQSDDYIILDHHKPEFESKKPEINHVNPYYYGIRGDDEISGAGVCYLFAKVMDSRNQDLAYIGIIGAIGDMQNNAEKGEFHGVNKVILEDALATNQITVEFNLAISRTKTLAYAIAYTLPIVLPKLTDSLSNVELFLKKNQIRSTDELGNPRTFLDLSNLERKTLLNALIKFALVECGMNPKKSKELLQNIYILNDFNEKYKISDAREMSSLLNACGRGGNSSFGIAALLGDEDSLKKAIEFSKSYKHEIFLGVNRARENIREYEFIRTVYEQSINEKTIGTICSILLHSGDLIDKPLIAFADSDNHTMKVSARADKNLIEQGIDLGIIMRKACQKIGIEDPAGGHPPAAGAKIPTKKLGDFIAIVNDLTGTQMKK
ncbi:MAG: DHH family phosphoesterase [Candidatus Lokiarchaeota archaeon]|nr:DHH family phosphoesterase [Candidatus Harpocratesius repetitus]